VFINLGGGELTTAFMDGRIRCEDAFASGNGPVPSKDKYH